MKVVSTLLLICLLGLTAGCSNFVAFFSGEDYDIFGSGPVDAEIKKQDYIDHLSFLAKDYVSSNREKVVRPGKRELKYLMSIHDKLVQNNELILKSDIKPKFYFIRDKTPFFFSLPNGHFFFSIGLIKNYLKNENLLVAILAYEIVKSHLNIYLKKMIIPVGHLKTEQMIFLTRVPMKIKLEVDKWTFYCMIRSGYDAFAFLNWLQMINKFALDFTFQQGDSQSISREEFLFKNFIISERIQNKDFRNFEDNSSPSFYKFVKYIGRIKV